MNSRTTLLTVITAATVAAIVSLLLAFSLGKNVPAREVPANLYSQIQSHGVIRAAYAVGAPLFIVDPNTGNKSGIFYDIVNEAAARLGLKVNWNEEVGYGQMIEGLQAGRYDLVGSGIWINADRARSADFTIPLYYDAVYAYAKVGDERFGPHLEQLNSSTYRISTMDGELGATIAQTDFPKAQTLQLPQSADFTQMILNVVNKKADITFLSSAAARAYQAANPGQIVAVDPTSPLRIFPNAIMLPQGQYELRQALDNTLEGMLDDGTINKILARYEKMPGSFLRIAPPYEPASSQ